MRQSSARLLGLAILAAVVIAPPARATCGGGGGGGMGGMMPSSGTMTQPQVYFVPWKVLNPGDQPVKGALVLYWIPLSRDEIKRSDLLNSRPLTVYSSQCVGMQLIRPDDTPTIEKLGAAGKMPIAILADADGKRIAAIDGSALRLSAVEKMVRDEVDARETRPAGSSTTRNRKPVPAKRRRRSTSTARCGTSAASSRARRAKRRRRSRSSASR